MLDYEKLEAQGYEVMSTGKILGLDGKRLKLQIRNGKPRISVRLKDEEGQTYQKHFAAHRLVAEKFCLHHPEGYDNVLIKDGRPKNIKAINLMWATLDMCKESSQVLANKELGKYLIESGQLSWRDAGKYNITPNTAYSIWKKAQQREAYNEKFKCD